VKSFADAWDEMKKVGFQYGGDALANVRFGWNIRNEDLQELFAAIRAAEVDREDRGKSTILPGHWETIMEAFARVDSSGADTRKGSEGP
jgi:hypothetical protein